MKNKKNELRALEKEVLGLWKKSGQLKKRELIVLVNRRIAFLQHERLIHLLVTLFFSGASLFMGWAVSGSVSIFLPIIFVIVLVVTMFYIIHYYYLENVCQKWQGLAIRLERELLMAKK